MANQPTVVKTLAAWEQCGLLVPWSRKFQNTARNIFDDQKLFPTQKPWECVPEGEEAEPAALGDAV